MMVRPRSIMSQAVYSVANDVTRLCRTCRAFHSGAPDVAGSFGCQTFFRFFVVRVSLGVCSAHVHESISSFGHFARISLVACSVYRAAHCLLPRCSLRILVGLPQFQGMDCSAGMPMTPGWRSTPVRVRLPDCRQFRVHQRVGIYSSVVTLQ